MGMKEDVGGKCFPAAWGITARPCDSCKSSAALLYCRPDSAFLCMGCDAKVHHRLGRHERVRVCEACEQAPASVTCKADAAALCVTCDRDIHSANPLAGRHERLPVSPFFDTAESVLLKSSATAATASLLGDGHYVTNNSNSKVWEPNSWILPNPSSNTITKFCSETLDLKSVELLLSDNDQLMDFDHPFSLHNSGSDSVVPVQQIRSIPPPPTATQVINPRPDSYFEMDLTNANGSFTAQSLNPSVSSSSLDGGVVPEGSSLSELSYSFGKGIGNTVPAQGTDREARVLRYREKRKNRRFEKTIRYASRKAYAETRPRIKGRFAKRPEVEPDDVDRIFASGTPAAFLADAGGYGVVPSF